MSANIRPINQHRSLIDVLYRLADSASILVALWITARYLSPVVGDVWLVGSLAVAVYFVVSEFTGLYRNWRGAAVQREIACAATTWGVSMLAVSTVGVTLSLADTRLAFVLTWLLVTPVLTSACRTGIRAAGRGLRSHGLNTRRFAIVGVNELGFQLARNIEANAALGLALDGFYDDRPEQRTTEVPDDVGRRIGDLTELVEKARSGEVDMIYIAFPMRAEDRIRDVLARFGDSTASVYIVPDFFVFELLHSRWTDIGGLPVVSVFEHPFYGVDGIAKRLMDLVLASALLVLLAIPMIAIGWLIKWTSPGPVFFRQRRYGLDGREILVWKFRSMSVCENGDRVTQATRDDPRVTRVGAILRKTSLDELPQLFNVLVGTMSLVGPRPHATAHNEHFRTMIQGYMLRHKIRPGITGLAQVSGCRGETDTVDKMQRRVEYDHRYIREWSIWLDVKILLKTVLVVFARENAY